MSSSIIFHNKNDPIQIKNIDEKDEYYIFCLSFEERSISALHYFDDEYSIKKIILLNNKGIKGVENTIKNHKRANFILRSYKNIDCIEYIDLELENPISMILKINDMLKKESCNMFNITIDITTIPKHQLLVLLYFLRNSKIINKIRLLYSRPLEYGSWLSSGYDKSLLLPFFEGPISLENKLALLVLSGYEPERILHLIDDIEPSATFIASSSPGTAPRFIELGRETAELVHTLRDIQTELWEIPANDPFECREIITRKLDEYKDYDFFVAPVGPKLVVIGLYLAYEKHKNFRIIYPFPALYNTEDYSSGFDGLYEIIL